MSLCAIGWLSKLQMFGIDYKEKQPSIKYIQETTFLRVDCISLKVIHVPGHSQGSLAFIAKMEMCFSPVIHYFTVPSAEQT